MPKKAAKKRANRSKRASARCTESISIASVASAPAMSKLSRTKDPGWEPPTCGLANLGNTCFLNSVLQNLFKTRLLRQALLGDASGRVEDAFVGPVTKALRKAILDIKGKGPTGSKRGAYSPKALLAAIQKAHPLFKGSHQQDAHELLMHLLGTLEDENLAACSDAGLSSDGGETTGASDQDDDAAVSTGGTMCSVLDRTAVTEVFGGTMCSVVTCSTCAARSFSTEPTMCLSLQIPHKKFVSGKCWQAEKAAAVETAKKTAALETAKKAPAVETAKKTAAVETAKKAPAVETAKKAPAVKKAEKAPAVEKAKKATAVETAKKAPAVETAKKVPAVEKANNATAVETANKAPAVETANKAPAVETAKKTPAVEKAKKAPLVETAKKATAVKTAKKATAVETANEAPAVETAKKATAVETANKAAAVETAKKTPKPVAALLGGARLSAKERRKISRQERNLQKAKGKDSRTQAPVAIEKELYSKDYGGRTGTGADAGGDRETMKADARGNGERVGIRPSLDSLNGDVGAAQSETFGIDTGGARACSSSGSHDGCVTDDGDSRADTPSSTASASSWKWDLSMSPAGVDNGARSPSPPPGDQATAQFGGVNIMDPEGTLGRKGSNSSDAVLVDSETDESMKSEDEEGESAADVSDVPLTTFDTFACLKNPLNRLVEPPVRATKVEVRDSLAVSMYNCLDHFFAEEALVAADGDGFNCEACWWRRVSSQGMKDDGGGESRQDARKRLLMLGTPPGVLVCHLQRLQATRKTCRRVEFDLDLDMSPYFWQDSQAPLSPEETRYRLFGLVQHRGSSLGGHYVAYVQDKDGWKYASDATVRPATLQEVKNCEAYMLFYERCDTPSCSIR